MLTSPRYAQMDERRASRDRRDLTQRSAEGRDDLRSLPLCDLCVKTSAFSACSAFGAITIVLVVCCAPVVARAQQSGARTQSGWKQPMTPWGETDLRGIWPLNHLISTPFQRPEKFGDRRFLTDEGVRRGAEERGRSQQALSIGRDPAGRRGAGHPANVVDDRPAERTISRAHRQGQRALRPDARQLQAGADGLRQP